MKITVCRCPVCGSTDISALAWVNPNEVYNGIAAGKGDITWSDRDGGVWCDDCREESDCWDEVELEGDVREGKVYVRDESGSLVPLEVWDKSNRYGGYGQEEQ